MRTVLACLALALAVAQPRICAADPRDTLSLDIPSGSYLSSQEGRGLLKYIVRCAFDERTDAVLHLPGDDLRFSGSVGLATGWGKRALTLSEQRWVSACLYALTNKLGVSVLVDLRADHPELQSKEAAANSSYSLHEAGFFGNVFAPQPEAYVCGGGDMNRIRELPVGQRRLCGQSADETDAKGRPLSRCGFIVTGSCSSEDAFTVGNDTYKEVVHVWLEGDR